jgi:thiol-disulfide isomerase/thioredoxin
MFPMLWSISVLAGSIPVHLANENFSSFVNQSTKPIFLKLWATWCGHCQEFAPVWEELANSSDLSTKVHIADIECESSRASCKGFIGGANYPRLYWMDPMNGSAVPYTGSRTLDHFHLFIKKQLSFPMVLVSDSEIDLYYATANITSVFLFRISESDSESLSIARNTTSAFRHFEARFLLDFGSDSPSLIAHTRIGHSAAFSGNWTHHEISDFIRLHSLPFMVHATSYILRHLEAERLLTFMQVTNISLPTDAEESISICESMSQWYPVTKTNCASAPWFCRYVDIDLNVSGIRYVIYDKSRKLFWVNHEKAQNRDSVLNWVKRVRNGEIGGRGPGDGFLGPLISLYYDQKAEGNPTFMFILGPMIVLAALGLMCLDGRSSSSTGK